VSKPLADDGKRCSRTNRPAHEDRVEAVAAVGYNKLSGCAGSKAESGIRGEVRVRPCAIQLIRFRPVRVA
jgi:hypothetical protein